MSVTTKDFAMSPTSSGSLEVEKYIGACLISQTRPKSVNNSGNGQYYSRVPDGYPYFDGFRVQRWAGGMPLISFANYQKRHKKIEHGERSTSPKVDPLSRLAVHTQGAPLILTKTFNPRRNKNQKNFTPKIYNQNHSKPSVVDCVSVTSDESSSSANSESCLPRIIKPRKRRKKDRKPLVRNQQDCFSTDSASPDIDTVPIKTYTPFLFDSSYIYGLVPETLPLGTNTNKSDFEVETPKLHHNFEDVQEVEVDLNGNQSTTVCQCRYCDPSGQIWDVDRSCYSPFLTPPQSFDFSSLLSIETKPKLQDEDYCLIHNLSSMSLEDDRDNKQDTKIRSGDLEVSTEIVTSLNGHRDIEIKFYSTPSVNNVCKFVGE